VKILDRYILTSFIQTFLSVFVILFFIFILQGIWLFIDQLAGKDLEFFVIVKFLGFYSPTIVPLVLPLSILLASIMTFGSFAENYEFAAMKSSGISLGRAMRSLMIFIVLLSIVAFFFANNVIPQAQYRFTNLRANIMQRKPAMAIVEGQFNSMGSFNIRVEKKHGENSEQLEGVTIHRRKFNPGSNNNGTMIIRAKNGLLKSSEKSNLLQLELYDGYYYEDLDNKTAAAQEKMPFAKSKFSRHLMNIDLSALNTQSTDDDQQVVHTNNMLNISELNYTLDSLQSNYDKELKSTADNLVVRPSSIFLKMPKFNLPDSVKTVKEIIPSNLLTVLNNEEKVRVLDLASNNESSTDYVVTSGITGLEEKIKNINGHWLALYDKFVIAYACLMMFFIGAPLGAIIRKGGLGLPIVFAVLIFIIFHFINTFGKKVAQEDGITPFMGAWMSSFVLTPFAVLFTYRATNDMNLTIDMDWLTVPIVKLFSKRQKAKQPVFNIAAFTPVQDDDWFAMQELNTDALIAEARTTSQRKHTEIYRKKVLKTLDARGITQEALMEEGNLYDVNYLNLELLEDRFKVHATAAFVLNVIAIILALKLKTKPVLLVPELVVLFGMYTFIISSGRCLKDINKITQKNYGLPFIIVILLGFPFYFILYFINSKAVKNALTHYTT
jgi:lipopolysaccharide export system permease protein